MCKKFLQTSSILALISLSFNSISVKAMEPFEAGTPFTVSAKSRNHPEHFDSSDAFLKKINMNLNKTEETGGVLKEKLDEEKIQSIMYALESGQSKASVCRTFQIPRATLYDYLYRLKQQSIR